MKNATATAITVILNTNRLNVEGKQISVNGIRANVWMPQDGRFVRLYIGKSFVTIYPSGALFTEGKEAEEFIRMSCTGGGMVALMWALFPSQMEEHLSTISASSGVKLGRVFTYTAEDLRTLCDWVSTVCPSRRDGAEKKFRYVLCQDIISQMTSAAH